MLFSGVMSWWRYFRLRFVAISICCVPLGSLANAQNPASEQPPAGNTARGQEESILYTDSDAYFLSHAAKARSILSLPRDVWEDEKHIASSPRAFRKADLRWIVPLAATTGLLLGTDHHVMTLIHTNPANRSTSDLVANGGLAVFAGAAVGSYGIGLFTHNEHLRETGRLSVRALADTFLATEALKIVTSRERPDVSSAHGYFEHSSPLNSSFPSQHAALAWTAATVFAQEYPGPLTQWSAYGLATLVSAARVTGFHHFPSDILIGAATGYLIGRFVYRANHDDRMTDRTGATPTFKLRTPNAAFLTSTKASKQSWSTGSPYIPLDSWIYPAMKRLAALGYMPDQVSDLGPWIRSECRQLVAEALNRASARDSMRNRPALNNEAMSLIASLREELDKDGESSNIIRLESLYSRTTGIVGKPLRDSYHFGQTINNDLGRPYDQGFNNVTGFSTYAVSGPFFAYFRGEYQYAPGRPAEPLDVRQFIASADGNPVQKPVALPTTNGFQTQEMYAGVKLGFENITFGKQNLWWGPGEESAFSFSNNATPFYSLRFAQARPLILPGVFSYLGKIRTEIIIGKLSGHQWPARPYVNAQKISLDLTDNLEVGFTRSSFFGGVGHPLTFGNIISNFTSTVSTGGSNYGASNDPGDRHSGFDFRYRVPGLRRYLTIYSDSYADDDPNPIDNPRRAAWGPGLYVSQLPGLRRLDFRLETYSTLLYDQDHGGRFIYWNGEYHDAYTNRGNILGSWVGRDARAYSGSSTYWFSGRSSVKASFRQIKTGLGFLPGGGTQTDATITTQVSLSPQWMVTTVTNYERYYIPVLGPPRRDLLCSLQIIFRPFLNSKSNP